MKNPAYCSQVTFKNQYVTPPEGEREHSMFPETADASSCTSLKNPARSHNTTLNYFIAEKSIRTKPGRSCARFLY